MKFEMTIESLELALKNGKEFNARNFIYKVTGTPVSKCPEAVEAFRKMVKESNFPEYLKQALDADAQRPEHAKMQAARERYLASLAAKATSESKATHKAEFTPVVRRTRRSSDEMFEVHQEQERKRNLNKQVNDHVKIVIINGYKVRDYYRFKLPIELKEIVTESAFYQRWYNVPDEEKKSMILAAQQEAIAAANAAAAEKRRKQEEEAAEQKRIEDERIAAEEAIKAEERAKKEEEADINAKAFRKALRDIEALDKIEEIPRIKEYVSDIDLAIRRHVQVNIETIKTDIDVLNTKLNAIMRALNVTVPSTLEPISRESKMTSQEYHKREEDLPSWGDYQRSKHQQRR